MGGAELTLYSIGTAVCLLVMTAAFAAAFYLFVRYRPMKRTAGYPVRSSDLTCDLASGRTSVRKKTERIRKKTGAAKEFRITEHVLSVHTDHLIR